MFACRSHLCVALLLTSVAALHSAEKPTGAAVNYRLPTDGPLPRTYLVTLAITDPKNPDWLVSTFVAGAPRTVTAENQGRFTEHWDGLDDNFMPVPAGDYGVKGIYCPAEQWKVDGEYHAVTPRFVTGASAWMPSPEQFDKPEPFGGDPVGSPLRDVAVGPNGVAVFYYQYLENGTNLPMVDLNKPLGHDQFIRAFPSGGAGGGPCVATDGKDVWAFSTDGGPKYVYRADGKPFGFSPGANRTNGYLPEGWVTAMAACKGSDGKTLVAVAQRGKIMEDKKRKKHYFESDSEFVDKITIHDGDTGKIVGGSELARPQGLAFQEGILYILHKDKNGYAVSAIRPTVSDWVKVLEVPKHINPGGFAVDRRLRFYFSDPAANKVFQVERDKITRTFGKQAAQQPGKYDPETFIAPDKLATWTDGDGNDRLLVVENGGPNRVSEWSADGKLLREFLSLQTKSNDGYAIDPEHPDHLYIAGHMGWLTRFKVDYAKREWTVDAVWPNVGDDPKAPRLDKPKLIRMNGQTFLACARSFNIYRLAGDRWVLSAAILRERPEGKPMTYAFWHDANGNGKVDAEEITPVTPPGSFFHYHGDNWLDDLSLVALNMAGRDVWRLAPSGFDALGNPVFKEFQRLFTDPVYDARAAGKADAVHGGNELADRFSSDWAQVDGSLKDGFFVQARGGKNFSANEGAQHKVSRYVPEGDGYRLKWRTGRTALQGVAQRGEMYGGMRIQKPVNGLVPVVDQSRCGILLYTDEGLYVDTLFPDGRRFKRDVAGIYPQGGEFFAGTVVPNKDDGKVYVAMGKYTPLIFEAVGWSLTESPVRPLSTLPKTVSITANEIASPPPIALSLRGGAGSAKLVHFSTALGDPAFDGTLAGWESAEPVKFAADKDQTVEVRCLYRPEQLLLRWHVRTGGKVTPRPLPPLERIFTHDQQSDTVSFYLQGDFAAKPGGPPEGRPGDARFVFGLFKDGDAVMPAALGLYPEWKGKDAKPQVYRTPVGAASFAHAGPVPGIKLGHALDGDGKGFVIVAAIPRGAIPRLNQPFGPALRTLANFEATLGGRNKFWWANADGSASRETFDEPSESRLYPGSWAPAEFLGLDGGVVVRHWLVAGPFGGPGAEKFGPAINGFMPGTKKDWKQEARTLFEKTTYPPDDKVDPETVYKGDIVQGYWPEPRGGVKWKPATIVELDQRVELGPTAQVWYGATWIHAPAATEVEFQFQGHLQTYLRWTLNGEPLKVIEPKPEPNSRRPVARKTVTLKPGWNEVKFRGYCVGYAPFRAGLIIQAPAEKLWTLALSTHPPGEKRMP